MGYIKDYADQELLKLRRIEFIFRKVCNEALKEKPDDKLIGALMAEGADELQKLSNLKYQNPELIAPKERIDDIFESVGVFFGGPSEFAHWLRDNCQDKELFRLETVPYFQKKLTTENAEVSEKVMRHYLTSLSKVPGLPTGIRFKVPLQFGVMIEQQMMAQNVRSAKKLGWYFNVLMQSSPDFKSLVAEKGEENEATELSPAV